METYTKGCYLIVHLKMKTKDVRIHLSQAFEQTFILVVMHSCAECLFGVSTPVLIAKQINSSHEVNMADHETE